MHLVWTVRRETEPRDSEAHRRALRQRKSREAQRPLAARSTGAGVHNSRVWAFRIRFELATSTCQVDWQALNEGELCV